MPCRAFAAGTVYFPRLLMTRYVPGPSCFFNVSESA